MNLKNLANKWNKDSIRNGVRKLFKGGFFHILTGNFLNRAIQMISSIIVVRLIDKVTYADLSYADNIFSYISLASGLGMASALLKFCSNDQSKALDKAFVKFSLKVGGTFEFLISLAACLLFTFIEIPYPNARVFLWALMIYPLCSYLVQTGVIYMRTQLENKKYAYIGLLQAVCVCIFSAVFILLLGAKGIIGARYLSVLIAAGLVIAYYCKNTRGHETERLSREQKKKFVQLGLSFGFAGFFSGIMPINESFLVNNIIKDPIVTSNFRVAGLLPQLLMLVSGAVTVYYFPQVARIKDAAQVKKTVINIALVNGLIIGALTLLGMLFTPLVIWILYGKQYLDAVPISYMLWLMRASNCIVRMVPINMLNAIGKAKFNLVVSIISCVVQCCLDYIFITTMGMSGVVLGAILVYLVSGVVYWIYFLRCCKKRTIA